MPKSFNQSKLLLEKISLKAAKLLDHPHINKENALSLASCPGRISFSKHSDYVNNDLLYVTDDRKTIVICQKEKSTEFSLELINSNSEFPAGKYSQLNCEKSSWHYYPITVLKYLQENFGLDLSSEKIFIAVDSKLPSAGGLSSSHALILSLIAAIADSYSLKTITELYQENPDKAALKKLLVASQTIENARGFNSGLGDPAAEMLSRKSKILCIKLEPELNYSYIDLPAEIGIITAPSFIKADKNLPEFRAVNENIKRYKNLNQRTDEIFGIHANYLGDLLYLMDEKSILEKLSSLEDIELANLALYALAEGARTKEIKESQQQLSSQELIKKLGKHLNLSHQAELFGTKAQAIDINTTLKQQSGYYGASTQINDELQAIAIAHESVYGSSISGAGLGGNNSILCKAKDCHTVRDHLIKQHYKSRELAEDDLKQIHISKSEDAAQVL